jgi:hypothetical protein
LITELVFFNLPRGITREEVMAKHRQTAPAWSKNEDLVHKFYFFDAAKNQGGGVYVWKTREATERGTAQPIEAASGCSTAAIPR